MGAKWITLVILTSLGLPLNPAVSRVFFLGSPTHTCPGQSCRGRGLWENGGLWSQKK